MDAAQVRMFLSSAETLYEKEDYTSATILYFKTWFALLDMLCLEKEGRAPKDHGERFRMLEKRFPDDYTALDKEFDTYRDTYARTIDHETCERIRKTVKRLAERELA